MIKADYYILPDIEELAQTSDPERQRVLRRRIAANVGDEEALARLLGLTEVDPATFYPEGQGPVLSTEATIDAFLDRFGSGAGSGARNKETGAEELTIVPAVDYLTLLELETATPAGEEKSPSEEARRLAEQETRERRKNRERESEPSETAPLTESFAKILIKNGNYERAMEILSELNLKNSEKSIYFADQMRFLRKLQLLKSRPAEVQS